MKAMVLAAGLGTRLRPLTDSRPKALVTLGGRTLLEITLARLRSFGVTEVIVNVHHFAGMVVDYLAAHGNFGMRVELSREDELLLDTGGGLRKAADFFLRDTGAEPFLVHNVDVLSSIDLAAMLRRHCEQNALATLAVQQRTSSRRLLLDAQLQLCGRSTAGKADEVVRAAPPLRAWAFAGIHVLSPRIFALMDEGRMGEGMLEEAPAQRALTAAADGGRRPERAFSIIPEYLRLAGKGERIVGFCADGCYWRDLGTMASLEQAAGEIAQGVLRL